MSTMRESRLFATYRALGLISSKVSAAIVYVPSVKLHAIMCAVGNVVHTYRSKKLALWNVSAPMEADIRCLAADTRFVYVGYANKIKALHFGRHERYTYDGHQGDVEFLMPFGAHLISYDSLSELRVWDVESQELYNQTNFDLDTFSVSALCHPATYLNKILLASKQGGMKLFNVKTNKLIFEFKRWNFGVTKLEQSPAIDVVAVGLSDGCIFLHNIKLDETLFSFKQDWGSVTSITFRTDGPPLMLTSCDLGHLAIWDLEKRKLLTQLTSAHDAPVTTLIALPNEPLVLTSSDDNSLKLWIFDNPDDSGRLLHCRQGHLKPPNFIRFHGNEGVYILSAGSEGTIKAFHTRKDHLNKNLGSAGLMRRQVAKKKHIDWESVKLPPCVYLASDTSRESRWDNVVCCHEAHSIVTTWTNRKNRLGDHKLRHERFANNPANRRVAALCCAISTCGNFALLGYDSGHVDIFNVQSGLYRGSLIDVKTSDHDRAHDQAVTGLCVDDLNRLVLSACRQGFVKFWNFKQKVLLECLDVASAVTRMINNKDNGLAALSLSDFSLIVIDVDCRRIVRRFERIHEDPITDLTFNQSGHWLISASLDNTIKVFDLTNACLIDVVRTTSPCVSLAFSPTGEFLATAHKNRLGIYLWASKQLYNPVSLKPLPFDFVPNEVLSFPSTTTIVHVDDVDFDDDENMQVDSESGGDSYVSPAQLSDDLLSLSGLSTPRWANLIDLDLIKERNKPLEPPKKPVQAPFFLPTVAGLAPKFDLAVIEDVDKSKESRVLSFEKLEPKSEFIRSLEKSTTKAEFQLAFDMLKIYGPSGIEIEIRNLNPLLGGSTKLMEMFLRMIDSKFDNKSDFELANSYLGLFVKLHRDVLWSANEEVFTNDCGEVLRSAFNKQRENWKTLDSLFANSLCIVNYVKSAIL